MLIKFKKPDPRAGLIARMDSSRGQQLIDAGSADAVAEGAAVARFAETRAALDIALRHLPGGEDDPDYVVRAMRNHFGAAFTDTDEAKVRELVVKPQQSADGGATLADAPEPDAGAGVGVAEPVQVKEEPLVAAPKTARGKK